MPSLDEIYTQKAAPAVVQQELDLHQELLKQYAKAKQMLQDAESSDEPLNYRVQALNAISSIISQLVKLQADLYQMEEIKKVEGALVETLKAMPEVREAFLSKYAGALNL
jgi:hydroxypyruvate isomerase